MRIVRIPATGEDPELAELEPPTPRPDELLVRMTASSLNPVDLAISAGRFYRGSPPPPYIPGCEGVGRVLEGPRPAGTRVWVHGQGIGTSRDGTLAEFVAVPASAAVDLPEGVSDSVACALGVAGLAGWMPLSWRLPIREGDRVLVLGATSTVGLVAVQAAKLLGAERVVAVGRRPERLQLAASQGADALIRLGEVDDLQQAFLDAFAGRLTYVVDTLWGPPLVAALGAASQGVRVAQIGQSASTEATIPSNYVRGRSAEIVGFGIFDVPAAIVASAYGQLLGQAEAGRIVIDVETYPVDEIRAAWARQAAGAGTKLVVTFS
jgi:NADPH2:quinone reductase